MRHQQELALELRRLSFASTGEGEVSLSFLFEPERHLAQLALARLTLIRPATTLCPLLEKELALELPRLSFAATEGGK